MKALPFFYLSLSTLFLSTALRADEKWESGLTMRVYHVGHSMEKLLDLVPGQTPNVDEKRDAVDFEKAADFSTFDTYFVVELSGMLKIEKKGDYAFSLVSDDGATLEVSSIRVIDNSDAHKKIAKIGKAKLHPGLNPFKIHYFQNEGDCTLKLAWRPPGAKSFELVPADVFQTLANVTRVVAPGEKRVFTKDGTIRPGSGSPLKECHPQWEIATIHPKGFNPQVGAMTVSPVGHLIISTFKPNQTASGGPSEGGDGKIWLIENADGDPADVKVKEIATGLSEPLGMMFYKGDLYITQRLELTRLKDKDIDGYYETHERVGGDWEAENYHHFHFGLVEKDGYFYSTLSTSIVMSLPGLNGKNSPNRGTLVQTNARTGEVRFIAGGLRTPNGICLGPEGDIFQTDNQGSWQPASRLNHLREGHFYGHYNNTANGGNPSLYADQPVTPAAVYFPQNEISNSPSQPIMIPNGLPYAGDLLVGEITMGGIRRVSLDKVNGEWQGCVYRFTQGLEGGVNRLAWGPDRSLYVGCIGASGNWSWNNTRSGLQRMRFKSDAPTCFEIARVTATENGFQINFSKPVPKEDLSNPQKFKLNQWTYQPSVEYGGRKYNEETLHPNKCEVSPDGKSVRISVDGLKEGYVVHFQCYLQSTDDDPLLSTEAWYTLNQIPKS